MVIVHVILSVIFGYSLAVLLVEKGEDWPVTILTRPLKFIFGKIYPKLTDLLECTVCASFWASLIGEIVLKFWITGMFLWPFTGVIALGVTWTIIELLNALDKPNQSQTHEDKPN